MCCQTIHKLECCGQSVLIDPSSVADAVAVTDSLLLLFAVAVCCCCCCCCCGYLSNGVRPYKALRGLIGSYTNVI